MSQLVRSRGKKLYKVHIVHWDVINEMVEAGNERHDFYLNHTGDPLIRSLAWLGDGFHFHLLLGQMPAANWVVCGSCQMWGTVVPLWASQ